jgi:hypothetical protein
LTSERLNGYLDRLRENLVALDEAITTAQTMSKDKDNRAALQWAKTLRDLVELRNTTLLNIKTHLLGRTETGSSNEPNDCYSGNSKVEFERAFQKFLSPWTRQDLNLECEDCHVESDQVTDRYIDGAHRSLCDKCCEKRTTKQDQN